MAIDQTTKIRIILQAGTESHEGSARALHSVLYTKELADAGATIRLVFDGAGTGWLARWLRNDGSTSRAAAVFAELDPRSWLDRLSRVYARRIQLGNVPDEALEPILAARRRHARRPRMTARDIPLLTPESACERTRPFQPGPFIVAVRGRGTPRLSRGCLEVRARAVSDITSDAISDVAQATEESACARHPLTDD